MLVNVLMKPKSLTIGKRERVDQTKVPHLKTDGSMTYELRPMENSKSI